MKNKNKVFYSMCLLSLILFGANRINLREEVIPAHSFKGLVHHDWKAMASGAAPSEVLGSL